MQTGLVVLVKDEEAILPEWLAFHRALGFERIQIFDDGSTDRTLEIACQAAARVGGIGVETVSGNVPYVERQRIVYERGLDMMRVEGVDWCLFIDADEFLTCTTDETLPDMLKRVDERAAVAFHWAFFGSSGYVVDPPGLVIENYLLRAPANFGPNQLSKSLVRPRFVQGCLNGHLFSLDQYDFPYADCQNGIFNWEAHGRDYLIEPWRVNHYFVRSKAWWDKKIARSAAAINFARNPDEWYHYDRNECFDNSAEKYGVAVRREMLRMGFESPALRPPVPDARIASAARLIREGVQNRWPEEEIARRLFVATSS